MSKTNNEILSIEVDGLTLREYLKSILKLLWREGEGFDGKRPFGNSSWQFDVYVSLIKNGCIEGELDGFGYVKEVDTLEADELVCNLIDHIFEEL